MGRSRAGREECSGCGQPAMLTDHWSAAGRTLLLQPPCYTHTMRPGAAGPAAAVAGGQLLTRCPPHTPAPVVPLTAQTVMFASVWRTCCAQLVSPSAATDTGFVAAGLCCLMQGLLWVGVGVLCCDGVPTD